VLGRCEKEWDLARQAAQPERERNLVSARDKPPEAWLATLGEPALRALLSRAICCSPKVAELKLIRAHPVSWGEPPHQPLQRPNQPDKTVHSRPRNMPFYIHPGLGTLTRFKGCRRTEKIIPTTETISFSDSRNLL
jgi:hypothetical protein